MTPNGIREKVQQGEPVINGWLSMNCAFSAEIMAAQGYDSLTVDLQHGIVDSAGAVAMLQAMRASGVTPMIRVPWLEPAAVMRALDAGALGVICPMVSTAEEAARLVSYMRYAPAGGRSMGPTRAVFAAGPDYVQHADDEVMCFAMIETAEGFANLDAILATPGLDGVYIGPSDLTLALTGRKYRGGLDREEPEMIEAIRKIQARAKSAGVVSCLHTNSADYAARGIGWGFDMVTIANDVSLLAAAAKGSLEAARAAIAAAARA